jgi:hypothetical protein
MAWKPYISPEEERKSNEQAEARDRLTYKVNQQGHIRTMAQSKEYSNNYDKISWGREK